MPDNSDALRALALIKESGFATGSDWARAHEIAQAGEGTAIFDAIHALLHRIEGDTGNAAYWDRRAGTDFGRDGFDAELKKLQEMAKGGA